MLDSLIKRYNEAIGNKFRLNHLVQIITPLLKDKTTVLDLGAFDGKLASLIRDRLFKTKFIGVDVLVPSKTYIPVKKYDGRALPFPDNSFDTVITVDVLHHTTQPEIVLKEAKRVTKKYIIVKDHYRKNFWDVCLLRYADYIGNKPYGVSLPYHFLKISEWGTLFKKVGLKVESTKLFRYSFFDPYKQVLFVLSK